jgi:uroporphyrinogen decarboxylase
MKINMSEWFCALREKTVPWAMPVMTYPGLELINKGILDAVTNGDVHAACIEALSKKYPSAAATSIMDLSVEAEAFGSPIAFSDCDVPTITGRILHNADDISALHIPEIGVKRTAQSIRAIERASAIITDRPLFGGMIGPFSLAGRLYDMTEIMTAVVMEPDAIHSLLEKTSVFLTNYLRAIKKAGANGVFIAEPAAGLLSPDFCDEFSSRYIRRMTEETQDDFFMVILHNCGASAGHLSTMLSTTAAGLHFGNNVDMCEILDMAPANILISGNIDPVGVVKNGTPAEVENTIRDLLSRTTAHDNFLLSTGCDVPPGTPVANIDAFYSPILVPAKA